MITGIATLSTTRFFFLPKKICLTQTHTPLVYPTYRDLLRIFHPFKVSTTTHGEGNKLEKKCQFLVDGAFSL